MRQVAVLAAVLTLTIGARAQEFAKPGPEHELLKKLVGTWDTTMKAKGMEFKGTMTYKMDLGGLWLAGSLESDLGGMKFSGKSMDTYDAKKQKYVTVWFDSLVTTPLVMEGTFDKAKQTLTMVGKGPGHDGQQVTWRSVSRMPNADTLDFSMYLGDAKEPMFTITYRRKK